MLPQLIFLSLLQTPTEFPSTPIGASGEFKSTVYKIETLISESKFAEASKLLPCLPRMKFEIQWDDSSVPKNYQPMFEDAREQSIKDWKRFLPDLEITVAKKGDVKISFQDTLPPGPDSILPSGAVQFVSENTSEPRIETVIALKRENPPLSIDPRHVQNEVGYAIGSFLGLAALPRPTSVMGRSDSLIRLEMHVSKIECEIARENIVVVNALKEAIEKKTPLKAKRAEMFISPAKVTHEPVPQGEIVTTSIEVTNRGNANLLLSAVVNCGCVSVVAPPLVGPNETKLIQVSIDSSRVAGFVGKNFVVYSNDPEHPQQKIDVDFWVNPAYRILKPGHPDGRVVPAEGLKDEFYIVYDPAKPFKITNIKVAGAKATVTYEEWSGSLADPELKESAKDRKGYKISYLVSPTERLGRIPMTLEIETDRKEISVIYDTTMLQWGIAALPDRLDLGTVRPTGGAGYFTVSRPGTPFKITSAASTSENVKVTAELQKNGEWRVMVNVIGKLETGRLDANIYIHTDDPKQPTLTIPMNAFIK